MKGLIRIFILLMGCILPTFIGGIAQAADYQSHRATFVPPKGRFVLDVYNSYDAEYVRVYTSKNLIDTVEVVFAGWANNGNSHFLNDYIRRGRTQFSYINWNQLRVDFLGGIQKPQCLQYRERLFKQPEVQGVCLLVDIIVPENTYVIEVKRGVFEIELPQATVGYGYVSQQDFLILIDNIRRETFVQNKEQRALNEISHLEYRRLMLTSTQLASLVVDTGFGNFDVREKLNVFESAVHLAPEILPYDLMRTLKAFGSFDKVEKLRVIELAPVQKITAKELVLVLRHFGGFDTFEKLTALEALARPLVWPTFQERDLIMREFPNQFDKQDADRILRRYGK